MRRRISSKLVGMALAGAVLAAAPAAPRPADPAPAEQLQEVHLRVGEKLAICGKVRCPAATRCDDAVLIELLDSADGPQLVGRAPGRTLCSAASASGLGPRWTFRLVVDPAEEPGVSPSR